MCNEVDEVAGENGAGFELVLGFGLVVVVVELIVGVAWVTVILSERKSVLYLCYAL